VRGGERRVVDTGGRLWKFELVERTSCRLVVIQT
jgi:hypothetical protein